VTEENVKRQVEENGANFKAMERNLEILKRVVEEETARNLEILKKRVEEIDVFGGEGVQAIPNPNPNPDPNPDPKSLALNPIKP